MSSRAGLLARRVPLLLALLLAGCPAGGFLRTCPDCVSGNAPGAATQDGEAKADNKDGEAKAEKPPPPHTLPQALCAYWRALCSHPCSSGEDEKNGEKKNGEGSNGSEDKGKKSPPAESETGKKKDGNGKSEKEKSDPAGSEDKGKKSPPAQGEGEKKEDEKKDSEKGNEEENGKKDEKKEEAKDTWFSAHAQATMDMQFHGSFPAAYTGPRSLLPTQEAATSLTATLFLAARLWDC